MEPKSFWKEMQRLCKQRGGTCDDSECGYDCPLCALPLLGHCAVPAVWPQHAG